MEGNNKTLKEEVTMNVIIVKRMVEIAGGLVLGSLASDAVNGLGKLAKKGVVNLKAKVEKPKK
jgi:hypothetical protein